eukprot:6191458-Pleurochrysis_carterae.AAC.1
MPRASHSACSSTRSSSELPPLARAAQISQRRSSQPTRRAEHVRTDLRGGPKARVRGQPCQARARRNSSKYRAQRCNTDAEVIPPPSPALSLSLLASPL